MPRKATLHFYGRPTEEPNLEWSWVESQLAAAGTYWVVARTGAQPHPRPVWGIWEQGRLYLSIGTPATVLALVADPVVTVHLDSGTDVVIVEGRFVERSADLQIVAAYNEKYDWQYDLEDHGPLHCVEPESVLAWRAGGWAGRDGFQQAGRWDLSEDA